MRTHVTTWRCRTTGLSTRPRISGRWCEPRRPICWPVMLNAADPAVQVRIKEAKDYAARMRDDPEGGEGMKQLAVIRSDQEAARDAAEHRYHSFEYVAGALQIAIVLASVSSVVTRTRALTWVPVADRRRRRRRVVGRGGAFVLTAGVAGGRAAQSRFGWRTRSDRRDRHRGIDIGDVSASRLQKPVQVWSLWMLRCRRRQVVGDRAEPGHDTRLARFQSPRNCSQSRHRGGKRPRSRREKHCPGGHGFTVKMTPAVIQAEMFGATPVVPRQLIPAREAAKLRHQRVPARIGQPDSRRDRPRRQAAACRFRAGSPTHRTAPDARSRTVCPATGNRPGADERPGAPARLWRHRARS